MPLGVEALGVVVVEVVLVGFETGLKILEAAEDANGGMEMLLRGTPGAAPGMPMPIISCEVTSRPLAFTEARRNS